MPTDKPPNNQINWKRAYFITLPLAALAILATALTPKPLITIAPYDGTIIRGADVRAPAPTWPSPATRAPAPPIATPPGPPPRPYELAPLPTPPDADEHEPSRLKKLRNKLRAPRADRTRRRRH